MNIKAANPSEGIKWVIDGVLAYGERPGYPQLTVPARIVDQWMDEVQRQGIRSVINMLSEDEMAVYYRHLGQPLLQYYADAGLEAREVAHEDLGVVVTKRVLLDRVIAAFENLPQPVIIHCSAGAERAKQAVNAICQDWKACAKKPRRTRRQPSVISRQKPPTAEPPGTCDGNSLC